LDRSRRQAAAAAAEAVRKEREREENNRINYDRYRREAAGPRASMRRSDGGPIAVVVAEGHFDNAIYGIFDAHADWSIPA